MSEHEEISRAVAAGESIRCIARRLKRATSTISLELIRNGGKTGYRAAKADETAWADGKAIKEDACPACKQGVLVLRSGPYWEFRSCSNFPLCSYKPKRREVQPQASTAQHASTQSTSAAISRPALRPNPHAPGKNPKVEAALAIIREITDGHIKR